MNQDLPPSDTSPRFSRAEIEAIEDPFARLRMTMKRLLDPGGCPWDREQTHASLKQYLIEEAYEVCEAIDQGDDPALCEELGDVGLQVVFHAELAERSGKFRIEDVYESICTKLLDRHPHVFGAVDAPDAETVLQNWEQIKREEKKAKARERGKEDPSVLDGVPRALPALQRSLRLQDKASRVGFDWDKISGVEAKVREELNEMLQAREEGNVEKVREEFGDLLFSLVNWARFLDVRPEDALARTCEKFIKRFRYVEDRAEREGKTVAEMSLTELDAFWEASKHD